MLQIKLTYIALIYLLLNLQANSQFQLSIGEKSPFTENFRISEQILLETDREIYMAGEKIQYSCFTYEPVLQQKLELSKIVYIEFFTSNNLVIEQVKIEMDRGNGSGYVEIPKRLSSGKYYLRAYTNYMKNYGCTGFAYSSVTVLNPFISATEADKALTSTLQKLVVHTKGGSIIPNFSNTVVCEFTDNSNHPVPGMGRLLDETDQVIATFTTNKYGIGSFSFTPLSTKNYRIEATADAIILEEEIEIPESSIKLDKIAQDQEYIQFEIQQYQHSLYPLQLMVHHAGSNIPLKEIAGTDSLLTFALSALPKGIIQFRLQNRDGNIYSRQNVFNFPQQSSKVSIATDKKSYGNRESVKISLEDHTRDFIENVLSVSVFLIEKDNLQEYLAYGQLEFIQSALYPFLGGSPYPVDKVIQDKQFLEDVLIARSSPEFSDNMTLVSRYEDLSYFPEISYDLIFGRVSDDNNELIASSPLIQTWVDTISTMQTTLTNNKGMFFLTSDRRGEQELIIAHSKHTTGNITVQDEFYSEFFSLAQEEIIIDPANKNVIKQQMLNLQINDSYRNGRQSNQEDTKVPFFVEPDRIFFIDDYIPLPTLEEFLFEVVPYILPTHSKGKTIIRMPFQQTNVLFGDDPLFLLDGVPLFDENRVAQLNCSDLLSVGVVYEKYFFQQETFDGIIDIRTRKGDASIINIPEDVYAELFTGIQPTNIETFANENSRLPYFKTQLFWNPEVSFTNSKNTQLKITTPDNNGDYLIRCSLKNPDGTIEYFYTTFEVVRH